VTNWIANYNQPGKVKDMIAPPVEHTVFDTTGSWHPWRPRFLRSTLRPFQPKRRSR